METYICILRGINVSGQKLLKMEELRKEFENLGFTNVKSYIQSGNVVFRSAWSTEKLVTSIKNMISDRFGYQVPVIIRTPLELEGLLKKNPFLKANADFSKLHVTFLSEVPEADKIKELSGQSFEDDFEIKGNEIFLHCPNGYGRTRLTNTFFESKLKITATTRNWKTVLKLVEMGKEA